MHIDLKLNKMSQITKKWYFSHGRPAILQASLRKRCVAWHMHSTEEV